MRKIHPNSTGSSRSAVAEPATSTTTSASVVLTVWRKSLLFNGNGFTVFDATGSLFFRVENYSSGGRGGVVLMDAIGTPLHTVRRKRLSFGGHWLVYSGEETCNPLFSVKKHVSLVGKSKTLARITPLSGGAGTATGGRWAYVVEGSYANRSCVVHDERQRKVAEVRRKEAAAGGVGFGNDVFRLVVEDESDSSFAMALVILLDQMF